MRTFATVAGLASLLAAPAAASGDLPPKGVLFAIVVAEYLIPDVRVQLREDERLVLSWPVHLVDLFSSRRSVVTALAEPQYQTSTSDLRLVAGARLAFKPDGVGGLLESGVVLGHDAGTGGMVGLGVIVVGDRPRTGLAIVGRATFLPDDERRYDLALDVTFMSLATMIGFAVE